jgi:hypothetical protein
MSSGERLKVGRCKTTGGHADSRTTLTDIRSRDRLSKSLAYVPRYLTASECERGLTEVVGREG